MNHLAYRPETKKINHNTTPKRNAVLLCWRCKRQAPTKCHDIAKAPSASAQKRLALLSFQLTDLPPEQPETVATVTTHARAAAVTHLLPSADVVAERVLQASPDLPVGTIVTAIVPLLHTH